MDSLWWSGRQTRWRRPLYSATSSSPDGSLRGSESDARPQRMAVFPTMIATRRNGTMQYGLDISADRN